MQKISRILLVAILASTGLAAFAQDKSDYFGQRPAAADVQLPPSKKIVITNATLPEPTGAPLQQQQQPEPVAPALVEAVKEPLPNQFQQFIFDSSGKLLPLFGKEFFSTNQTTFAPIAGAPVPSDYVLGAGDELLIRAWGSIDVDYRAKIDRNGLVAIPGIGSIVLAGVNAGAAEDVVRAAIGRLYKGVTVSVNFGQLRAITIYVVGQAQRPGTYTVSSLSTLVTAVFASGGPNQNGSMRRIQVKRGSAVAAELDLYAFIAKGDKSGDIKLRDGDVIVIPPAAAYAAITGKVNSPAVYELRGTNDTVGSLLDFAGGMPVVADPRRAFIERVDATRSQPRSVEQFALDTAGLSRLLKNGDVINITSITPDFSNAVVLRGNVAQSLRVPFTKGMRISDLIPSRDYLITRTSVNRQNNLLGHDDKSKVLGEDAGSIAANIGSLIDEVNWEYAVVERISRETLTVGLIPFNLGKVFSEPAGSSNLLLQPGDTVTIFSQKDVAVPMDKRRIFVRIEGEVNVPGVYQMSAGETLPNLLARAGGATADAYLFGTALYREQVRKEQQANLERAADRLESQIGSEESLSTANVRSVTSAELAKVQRDASLAAARQGVARLRKLKATGRIAFGLAPTDRALTRLPALRLENGDRLVIPARADFVHVFGAVNSESSPMWRRNGRVDDYLKMAGLTLGADVDNVFILRVDGSVIARGSSGWSLSGFGSTEVMPGDSIVVPEKFDKESAWTKFTQGTKEWAQIFANFGLGAAAVKTLRN